MLLALVLAAGCAYEWRHQRYGSPAAPGAAPILPDPTPWIGDGIEGSTRYASPVAARISIDGATILVTACNLYERTYVQMIFPPFVPYWSTTLPSRPLVVGLGLEGTGTWRVDLTRVWLVRDGSRAAVARWSEDRYGMEQTIGREELEPCRLRRLPDQPIDQTPVLFGPTTLWLAFDVDPDPTVAASLEVEGISFDGTQSAIPPIALEPGSRLFAYPNAP
jgi:hypothetical protein